MSSTKKHLIARKQLGLFFANRRKEMGHSCKAVADFIGITENTLQRIENGSLDFELSLLFRICEALDIKPFFVPLEDINSMSGELLYSEPKLEDAHAMSLMHGADFEVPNNQQLSKLKEGDFVKVNASGERFWVKVKVIDFETKTIIGKIDNDLVCFDSHGLKADEHIKLGFQNIYAIHKQAK